MRYRNDSDYSLTVATDPVTVLEPGDELDHDVHVAGLTPADDAPSAASEPAPAAMDAAHIDPAPKPAGNGTAATSEEATA